MEEPPMLSFSEILDVLMKQHDCRAVDICTKLGMSKSYFSRLKKGLILPKNYLLVQELSSALGLPSHEKQMLINAYKFTKLGEDFLKTESYIEQLYNTQMPELRKDINNINPNPQEETINGMENVAEAVAALINNSKHTDCLFIPENKNFCNLIREITIKQSDISWLIFLENSDKSYFNISVFNETVSVLLAHQAEARYLYKSVDDYCKCTAFPYIFIAENEILMLERNCEKAFRFGSDDFIAANRRMLRSLFETAKPFVMVLTGFEEYLENWETVFEPADSPNSDDLLIIEKYPCIIHEASYSDISSHISDTEHNDRITRTYLEFLKWSAKRLRKQEMLFTIDGIREYFSSETFHEYSKHLTRSIPKPLRRQLFAKLIEMSKKIDHISPRIMNDFPFSEKNIRTINIWKSGILLIVFDFENAFRIAILQEKTISSSIRDYFRKLEMCGVILSEKEAIAIMEQEFHDEVNKLGKELT